MFDVESNKSTIDRYSSLSRPRSRPFNRTIRVSNVLLALTLLAYLYRRSSVDLNSMLDKSILDLSEPGIDPSLPYETYTAGLSNVDWTKYA